MATRSRHHDLHAADVTTWLGHQASLPGGPGTALAAAVAWLWNTWQQASPAGGRTQLTLHDMAFTVIWRVEHDRMTALVAGPEFVEHQWLSKVRSTFERQRLQIRVGDSAPSADTVLETRRSASQTGLPWMVAVQNIDSPESGGLTSAQTFWLGGLGVLVSLVVAATAMIGRAMARELRVARLQNDFVAAVSHEFRTPLTSMRQLTEMLLERSATPPERQRSYYEALARQTERLHRLVESLLDFGRMEAGRSPYRREPLEAGALVASVGAQFAGEAASRGYAIEVTTRGAPVTVVADRDALTNALWNLLDNAVKYSPVCRTVWLDTDRERDLFTVRVRDSGVGIPPAEHEAIFEKFVRGEHAKAEKIAGTGIGLAMVAHIVRAHDGRVAVESIPGRGSTFTIQLPIADACPES